MRVTVSITPIDEKISNQSLPCSYQWKNKLRMLMSDNSISENDLMEQKDKPRPYDRMITFDKNNRKLEYTYESDEKLQTGIDKKIEMTVRDFWKNHPMINPNGHPILGINTHIMFNMVDFTDKSINEIKIWRDKLAIATKVNELSYDDKANICYYYGENPQGSTENDLTLRLANFVDGICYKEDAMSSFIKIWIKSENSDKDVIINARKALSLHVIEEKSYDGKNSYYLGETFIGTCFNDIVAYCLREEKIYNDFIVRQVVEKENFKAEKKESKVLEMKAFIEKISSVSAPTQSSVDKVSITDEHDKLKAEARTLKSEGFLWKGFNIEKADFEVLNKIVTEGRRKKSVKIEKKVLA